MKSNYVLALATIITGCVFIISSLYMIRRILDVRENEVTGSNGGLNI